MASSEGGILSSFLLKGMIAPPSLKSQYIDPKKIVMAEDKPLLLIPFYSLNFCHFLTKRTPHDPVGFQITSASLHPSASIIAFQNSITLGTQNGTVMKWNSNIDLQSMSHILSLKQYGTLYGKGIVDFEPEFP